MSNATPARSKVAPLAAPLRLKPYLVLSFAAWTLLVAGILFMTYKQERVAVWDVALHSAKTAFMKDLAYRRWNASHGGVYVPLTEATPANSYLDVPEKNIPGVNGQTLTLMNPAYMTRHVQELFQRETSIITKLTSLKPINPKNGPDAWEERALRAFEQSPGEMATMEVLDGKEYFRLINVLRTEESCLKCHVQQGYKVGDIRGAISVSIPIAPYLDVMRAKFTGALLGLCALWLAGLCGLGAGFRQLKRQIDLRFQAEQGLYASEALLQDTSRLGKIGGFVHDAQRNATTWSDEVARIFSLPLDAHPTLHALIVRMRDENDQERFQELIRNAATSGGRVFFLEVALTPDTSGALTTRWIEISGKVESTGENQGKIIGTVQDITERKEFERLREDIERVMRHDLKGPLNGVIGLPQIMLEDNNLTADQREMLALILSAGRHMQRMIDLSLDLFKMEQGAYQVVAKPLNLAPLLHAIVGETAAFTRKKLVALELLLDGQPLGKKDSVFVLGEEILVYALFHNLIRNACEAAPEASRVTITVTAGNPVAVAIHNQGAVPVEIRRCFFDKYSTAGKFGGTGLGTYSAKLFAESLGGAIGFETSEEQGTTVSVALPAATALGA